ncbi:unnamed protein product [Rhizoctonia solani]|uniref:Hydrolase Mb2248c n=1 Tax=Rhizoctonia solani TaxID=456999 RepID=A0A8H3B8S3_9AGAM|nr:unnamed protein product [Rhizoctonia solani]
MTPATTLALLTSLSFSTAIHARVIPLSNGYHRYTARNNNLEWKNCSQDGFPGRECTRFEVPLDWHNDEVGKASLAVIRYPAIKEPKLGTLFMNPGGPGGSGVETVQGADGDVIMQHSGGNYDLVSWDPRGVGQTIPRTACFKTAEEEAAFWNGTFLLTGPEVRGNLTSQAELDKFYSQADEIDQLLQRIGEQCVAYSPDVFQYVGTAATVRDMVAMHDALEGPDKPINFWGMSYGTVIGMYFVNMFPDRIGHVILDGVVDPTYWANRPAHEAKNALESTDETFDGFAEECAKAGPSRCPIAQESTTASGIHQWTRDLISAAYDYGKESGPSPLINSALVRNFLFANLYRPQLWTNLSQNLYDMKIALDDPASANLTRVKRWLPDPVDARDTQLRPRSETDNNQTLPAYNYNYEAIGCSDAVDGGNITTRDVFDFIVQVTHNVSHMFGPVGMPRIGRPFCHHWPVRAVERYAGPWNKTLSNPILVIGNTADPATPYQNAKWVADTLGSSAVLIEQGGYGHVSRRMPSNCTISAVQKYFVHNELPKQDMFCETSTNLFLEIATTGNAPS